MDNIIWEEKLWGDMQTLEDYIGFMESGRAWETGIMAQAIVEDIVSVYKELAGCAITTKEHLVRKNSGNR